MHGQKRSEYKSRLLNPETASKLATKAQQWNALSHELLSQRRRLHEPSSSNVGVNPPSPHILLSLTENMLTVNPDPTHLWNIRREMLLHLIEKKESNFDVQRELSLTAHCLQRNPKAYAAWFHRKWSVSHMLSSGGATGDQNTVMRSELDLCAQFLKLDERNFHCWNYRRYVVALLGSIVASDETAATVIDAAKQCNNSCNGAWENFMTEEDATSNVLMGAQIESKFTAPKNPAAAPPKAKLNELIMGEWDFTTLKIHDNFSNGSAFHYRSKLLPIVLASRLTADNKDGPMQKQEEILSMAREEWEEILLNAIFTEPDDQTPWWYHRFIVVWAKPPARLKDQLDEECHEQLKENYEALLLDMADSLRELLEIEKENGIEEGATERDESKSVKCKWAYLGFHLVLVSLIKLQRGNASELFDEAKECLESLISVDPCRSERYKMLASELSA